MSKPLELELHMAVSHNKCWESNSGLLEEPVLLPYEPLPDLSVRGLCGL